MYQGDLRASGLLINGPGDICPQPRRDAGYFLWFHHGAKMAYSITSRDPKIYEKEHKIVRRSGVELEDVIDTITNGKHHKFNDVNDIGVTETFHGKHVSVTINIKTGKLVQCNPVKPRK
jgi:hypothetical protein